MLPIKKNTKYNMMLYRSLKQMQMNNLVSQSGHNTVLSKSLQYDTNGMLCVAQCQKGGLAKFKTLEFPTQFVNNDCDNGPWIQ